MIEVEYDGIGQAFGPWEGSEPARQAVYRVIDQRAGGDEVRVCLLGYRRAGQDVAEDAAPLSVPSWRSRWEFVSVAILGPTSRRVPQWTRTRVPRVELPDLQL